MDRKAQRDFHKKNGKNGQLELKAEHAKQEQAIELQKLELQTRDSEALFVIIQERQNEGNHWIVWMLLISINNISYTSNIITTFLKCSLV